MAILSDIIESTSPAKKPIRWSDHALSAAYTSKCQVLAEMDPEVFLRLTASSDRPINDKTDITMRDVIRQGAQDIDVYRSERGGASQVPFLRIDLDVVNGRRVARVVGHEGRHRSQAYINAGIPKIMVALCIRPSDEIAPEGHYDKPGWRSFVYDVTFDDLPETIEGQTGRLVFKDDFTPLARTWDEVGKWRYNGKEE